MRKILSMCLLQLEEYHPKLFNYTKKQWLKVIILILAGITCLSVIYYYVIGQVFTLLLQNKGSEQLLSTILMLFFVVCTIALVLKFLKRVYNAKDNNLFVTLPVDNRKIYVSKFLSILIEETVRDAILIIPLLIMYCIYAKFGAAQFALILPAFILFVLSTISTAVILSIPVALIVNLIKQNSIVTLLSTVILLAVVFYFYMLVLGGFLENFNILTGTLKSLQKLNEAFQLIYDVSIFTSIIANMFYGKKFLYIIFAVLYFVVAIFLGVFFGKWSFKKYFLQDPKKRSVFTKVFKTNTKHSIFKKDIALLLRSPDVILSCFLFAIIMPLFMYSFDTFLNYIDLSSYGFDMIKSANILTLSILVLLNCGYCATAISNEGGNFYLLKVSPVKFRNFVKSKILINAIFTNIFVIITLIVLLICKFIGIGEAIFLLVMSVTLNLGKSCASLEADLKNPNLDFYDHNDIVSNSKANANSVASALIFGLVLGVIAMVALPFIGVAWVYTIVLVISVGYMLSSMLLFNSRLNYYFRNLEI